MLNLLPHCLSKSTSREKAVKTYLFCFSSLKITLDLKQFFPSWGYSVRQSWNISELTEQICPYYTLQNIHKCFNPLCFSWHILAYSHTETRALTNDLYFCELHCKEGNPIDGDSNYSGLWIESSTTLHSKRECLQIYMDGFKSFSYRWC